MHSMHTIVYKCSANQPLKCLKDLAWPNYIVYYGIVSISELKLLQLLNRNSHDNCSDDEDRPQIPKHYKPVVCSADDHLLKLCPWTRATILCKW